MTTKKPRKPGSGGKRPGAGRIPGTPRAKLQITLTVPMLEKIDKARGGMTRSEYFEKHTKFVEK